MESAPFFIPSTLAYSVHSPPGSPHLTHCHTSRYHNLYLRSHQLSLHQPFTLDINPFLHSLSGSIWTAFSRSWISDLNRTRLLCGHWCMFVLVSSFLFLVTCTRLWIYADHTQLSSPRYTFLSYRTVSYPVTLDGFFIISFTRRRYTCTDESRNNRAEYR